MHAGKSIEEVKDIVDAYRTSGLTKLEYCHEVGLNFHTLDWYIKRSRNRRVELFLREQKNGFTHFLIEEELPKETGITLKYKDLIIEVKENFHPPTLKKIIKVIGVDQDV